MKMKTKQKAKTQTARILRKLALRNDVDMFRKRAKRLLKYTDIAYLRIK